MFNLFNKKKTAIKKEGYLSLDGSIYNTLEEANRFSFRHEMYSLFKTHNIYYGDIFKKKDKVIEILERYT